MIRNTYPDDEVCAGCGMSHEEALEAGVLDKGEKLTILECPRCGYTGCEDCIPGGVGCICLECEERGDE